jgi:hypothetical protein
MHCPLLSNPSTNQDVMAITCPLQEARSNNVHIVEFVTVIKTLQRKVDNLLMSHSTPTRLVRL